MIAWAEANPDHKALAEILRARRHAFRCAVESLRHAEGMLSEATARHHGADVELRDAQRGASLTYGIEVTLPNEVRRRVEGAGHVDVTHLLEAWPANPYRSRTGPITHAGESRPLPPHGHFAAVACQPAAGRLYPASEVDTITVDLLALTDTGHGYSVSSHGHDIRLADGREVGAPFESDETPTGASGRVRRWFDPVALRDAVVCQPKAKRGLKEHP